MKVDLNTNLSVSAAQLAAVQSKIEDEGTGTATHRSFLGLENNVKVTTGSMDLDKLLAQVQSESMDAQEKSARNQLSSVLETVLAYTRQGADISENNVKYLDEAANASKELDGLNEQAKGLDKQHNELSQQVKDLTGQVDKLKKEIEAETDPVRKEELEQALEGVNDSLKEAQEALTGVDNNLLAINEKKVELNTKINDCLNAISDPSIIRAVADGMKMSMTDVLNIGQALEEKERSEEEEKFLDKNNPVRVFQNAIARHDIEFLEEEIENKREIKA